jgi:hypothetical protein
MAGLMSDSEPTTFYSAADASLPTNQTTRAHHGCRGKVARLRRRDGEAAAALRWLGTRQQGGSWESRARDKPTLRKQPTPRRSCSARQRINARWSWTTLPELTPEHASKSEHRGPDGPSGTLQTQNVSKRRPLRLGGACKWRARTPSSTTQPSSGCRLNSKDSMRI